MVRKAPGMISTDPKVIARIEKRLKTRNARFRKLPKAKQRVALAKDVIQQLDARKLIASHCYFGWKHRDDNARFSNLPDKAQFGTATSQTKCEVCGIGSLLVAAAELADQLPVDWALDITTGSTNERFSIVDYLAPWFSSTQLDMIEMAYEQTSTRGGFRSFYTVRSDKQRLRAIMKNIIANNGRFVP